MTATRVTFAEVLRDEYEYFHDPAPLREWKLLERDVHDLPALVEKVRTIQGTERASETFPPALSELARRVSEPTPAAVVDTLGAMVSDEALFATLRNDPHLRTLLLDREHPLLRRLASIPHARRQLFTDPEVARRIAEDPALIDVFTSRSPGLLLLMATEGCAALVKLYPSLLATVADSAAMQRYLSGDGDAVTARARRKELVSLFRNASTKMRAVKPRLLSIRRKAVTAEVDDRMNILSRDAQALLETLPGASAAMVPDGNGGYTHRGGYVHTPDEAAERAALSQFNVLLLECAYGGHIADGHDLRDLYSHIHEKNMAALCLSGGGIRSATFNLGILQGLAEQKLLTQFHYLSTVSGGGYIGSWLSSWMRRHSDGPWGVARDLCAKPEDPLAPEVPPIQHLRAYSSYLAPRGSTLSVDTWTIVATYLRNLLLNWTMLIPALLAFLVIPRAVEMLVVAAMTYDSTYGIAKAIMFLGGAASTVALAVTRPPRDRPTGDAPRPDDLRDRAVRFRWWLIPLLLGGLAFTAYWAALLNGEQQLVFGFNPLEWKLYAVMFAGANFAALFIFSVRRVAASIDVVSPPERPLRDWFREWKKPAASRPAGWSPLGVLAAAVRAVRAFRIRDWARAVGLLFVEDGRRLVTELAAGVFAGALGGILLFAIFKGIFPPESLDRLDGWPRLEVYVCVALPLFLAIFFIQAALLAGLTTNHTTDHAREWWARSSSWIFISGIAYLVIAAAVILAPIAIIEWKPVAASLGGTSAIVAWLLARGSRMAAAPKEKEVVGEARWRVLTLRIAALVCLLFLVALLSLVTTTLLGWAGSNLDVLATAMVRQNKALNGALLGPATETYIGVIANSTVLEDWIELLKEQKVSILSLPSSDWLRWHFAVLRGSSELVIGVFVALMLTIALIMSRFLNVNIYSMHGMYRNRLIRAYLGASRIQRRADPFTGFDPRDNLDMWQLRPEALWTSSFPEFDAFIRRFVEDEHNTPADAPRAVLSQLPECVRARVLTYDAMVRARRAGGIVKSSLSQNEVQVEVVDALNRLMLERDLRHDLPIEGSINSFRANRVFLDQRFAGVLAPCASDRLSDRAGSDTREKPEKHNQREVSSIPRLRRRPPLHVLNMALNLVGGQNLAWRERKADSFTVTALHAGNKRLGYRDSVSYGEAISLGTAVAVSGAAVSPNQGYNSSPVVTFLMTLFNARLGWWLGNPGPAGDATYATAGPKRSIKSIFDEAFGRTTDTSDYVFLSDGGHFDNLGLYEMVLRRCRYIVVCDASEDHRYAFGDLANAVRKIRVDLGIDIRLKSMFIAPEDADHPQTGRYCALGCIDYDRVDEIDKKRYPQKGFLIYIKPVVYADCPPDVRNYRKENQQFPHESTADQFFSESQFESYRALGQHSVQQICESLQEKGKKKISNDEVRTIFQLFRGTAQYLEAAMKEQAEKDEAMTFFEKHLARRAAAAAAATAPAATEIPSPGA